jgi:hypothetical protein
MKSFMDAQNETGKGGRAAMEKRAGAPRNRFDYTIQCSRA